jgi:hypothetical protein
MPQEIIKKILNDETDESRINFISVIKQLYFIYNSIHSYDEFKRLISMYDLRISEPSPNGTPETRLDFINKAKIFSYFIEHNESNEEIEQLLYEYDFIWDNIEGCIESLDDIRRDYINIIRRIKFFNQDQNNIYQKMIKIYNKKFMTNYAKFLFNHFELNEQDIQRLTTTGYLNFN